MCGLSYFLKEMIKALKFATASPPDFLFPFLFLKQRYKFLPIRHSGYCLPIDFFCMKKYGNKVIEVFPDNAVWVSILTVQEGSFKQADNNVKKLAAYAAYNAACADSSVTLAARICFPPARVACTAWSHRAGFALLVFLLFHMRISS